MIDTQTDLRMRMLAGDSVLGAYAFKRDGEFLLVTLPPTGGKASDADIAEFTTAVQDAMKQGGVPVAHIALMNQLTPEGEALIDYELFPGATETDARNAAVLFKVNLVEKGIITFKPDTDAPDA